MGKQKMLMRVNPSLMAAADRIADCLPCGHYINIASRRADIIVKLILHGLGSINVAHNEYRIPHTIVRSVFCFNHNRHMSGAMSE